MAGLSNLPAVSSLKYCWYTFCILIRFKGTTMSLQSVEAKLLAAKELVRQTLLTITEAQRELQKQFYALQTEIDNLQAETQSAPVQTQSAPVQTQSASVQTQSASVQNTREKPTEQEIQEYIQKEDNERKSLVFAQICPLSSDGYLAIPPDKMQSIVTHIWSFTSTIQHKAAILDVFEDAIKKLSPNHRAMLIKQNRNLTKQMTNKELALAIYNELKQGDCFRYTKTRYIVYSDTYNKYHEGTTQTPQAVTPQPVQTKSALPTLLLVKRCGSLFLYQNMDGVIVAKRELLPQPTDIKPVPDSVSELNPLHFVVEYGTEGATKILERYTHEQLTQSALEEKLETEKEIKTLTKEKLINLIVRRCVKRLNQDMGN